MSEVGGRRSEVGGLTNKEFDGTESKPFVLGKFFYKSKTSSL